MNKRTRNTGKPLMDAQVLEGYRRRLLEQQRALFDDLEGVENDLHVIEQGVGSELEERSQEEAAASLLSRLQEHDAEELARIHDALWRIREGAYGRCTGCGKPIKRGRLDALPIAELCIDCERDLESRRVRGAELETEEAEGFAGELPPELEGLDDDEITGIVVEALGNEMGDATTGLSVSFANGTVLLEGELPNEELLEVAVKVIETEIGLSVIDRVRLSEFGAPVTRKGARIPRDAEAETKGRVHPDESENVFEAAEEGTGYRSPSRPVPERE